MRDDFLPFELERWQGIWEHRVRHNLSESGVHPLRVRELLEASDTDPEQLAEVELGYSQTNGTDALRAAIAVRHPGATADNVLVTIGSSEANFIATWTLVRAGDRVTIQVPCYGQTLGLATNLGADITRLPLRSEAAWTIDPDAIIHAIPPETQLVVVTNPNNPTGACLDQDIANALVTRCQEVDAWLLVDEVYRGAERIGSLTPSLWGSGARTVVTGGLSKAYGLPGLRIGWIVASEEFIAQAVRRHDYAVIGPSAVSDFLAVRALRVESQLRARARHILSENYPIVDAWLASFGGLFEWVPPRAGAVCYAHCHADLGTDRLVEHLRAHHDTLVVPGEHFEMPGFLRFGYGAARVDLEAALDAAGEGLKEVVQGTRRRVQSAEC